LGLTKGLLLTNSSFEHIINYVVSYFLGDYIMGKRDAVETKARILATAEKLFSTVGFDKTRVDDIAKEAGVNKALIYYYFKSKDEILDTLFTSLIDDVKLILIKSVEETPDISREDEYRRLFKIYMDFITEKRKIIKVAIAESAKVSEKISVVLKLGDLINNAEVESIRKAYEAKGLGFPVDKQEMLVMEFFTGLMPLFTFAIYKDEWENFYNVSEAELFERFFQVYKKAHLEAHMRR
jgi:TetR/AcrR family transcriptional regulator